MEDNGEGRRLLDAPAPGVAFLPDISRRGFLSQGKEEDLGRISQRASRPNVRNILFDAFCVELSTFRIDLAMER